MSYDISFYKRKENSISKQEVFTYLEENGFHKDGSESQSYLYENKRTGVYCMIQNLPMLEESVELEILKNIEEFEALNITLVLNNLRPDFFGKEISLFVDDFVKKFDLYVYPDDGDGLIIKLQEDEIYKRWSASNKMFALLPDFVKQSSFYPLEKSNKLWEYAFCADKMQVELGEDCYVPNIFYLKNKNTQEVVVACTWTEHIPTVIPPVDYVLLNITNKGFFSTRYRRGFISYDSLMDSLGFSFEDYKMRTKIIKEEQANKVGDIFDNLSFDVEQEDFDRVELELITNYKES